MTDSDPYGLPTFPGEQNLSGWTDHSQIAMRSVRVFSRGPVTVTLIHHPALWDLIASDGRGDVQIMLLASDEIAPALAEIARSSHLH